MGMISEYGNSLIIIKKNLFLFIQNLRFLRRSQVKSQNKCKIKINVQGKGIYKKILLSINLIVEEK